MQRSISRQKNGHKLPVFCLWSQTNILHKRTFSSAVRTLLIFTTLAALSNLYAAAKPVILDTDIGGDIDDLGTVAVLHGMANNGEVEILATISHSAETVTMKALDAINTFYNRPDIPVAHQDGTQRVYDHNYYTRFLAEEFENDFDPATAPSATELYRQLLSEAEDASVYVVSVGGLCNIRNLINSPADEVSPLNGLDLFNRKVKDLIVMGGNYPCPEGNCREANFVTGHCGTKPTKQVLDEVTTPMLFSGMAMGLNNYMILGEPLRQLPEWHIVRAGYLHFCKNPPEYMTWLGIPSNTIVKTATFDQNAMIAGLRPDEGYFEYVTHGYNVANSEGLNSWLTDKEYPKHRYIQPKMDPAAFVQDVLTPLMKAFPAEPVSANPMPVQHHMDAASPQIEMAAGKMQIALNAHAPWEVSLYTLQGKRVYNQVVQSASATIALPKAPFASAAFIVEISQNGRKFQKNVVPMQ